jgi:DNA-binding XRE family transcriptional regulator
LREAELELARGQTVPRVAKKIGLTEQTYYRRERQMAGIEVAKKKGAFLGRKQRTQI